MSRFEFCAAVREFVMKRHVVPTPLELAEWMRAQQPDVCEPWAARLMVIPADAPRYPIFPDEYDLHRISLGAYDMRWWTPGATAGPVFARLEPAQQEIAAL